MIVGLALHHQISVQGGVIDPDYRGNICVILHNHGENAYIIHEGDRVAQLICEKFLYPEIVEVQHLLDSTGRGGAGFGSTGIHGGPTFRNYL